LGNIIFTKYWGFNKYMPYIK